MKDKLPKTGNLYIDATLEALREAFNEDASITAIYVVSLNNRTLLSFNGSGKKIAQDLAQAGAANQIIADAIITAAESIKIWRKKNLNNQLL